MAAQAATQASQFVSRSQIHAVSLQEISAFIELLSAHQPCLGGRLSLSPVGGGHDRGGVLARSELLQHRPLDMPHPDRLSIQRRYIPFIVIPAEHAAVAARVMLCVRGTTSRDLHPSKIGATFVKHASVAANFKR